MLSMKNRTVLRCFLYSNNSLTRGAFLLGTTVVFLIILVARLKQNANTVIGNDRNIAQQSKESQERNRSKELERPPKQHPMFPLVNEFILSGKIKFNNEDARPIGFPVEDEDLTNLNSSKTKLIYLATPYFGEWNPRHYYFLHFGNATFARYQCPIHNCHVTKDSSRLQSADAVLFHVRDMEVFSIPSHQRSPKQVWILYSMEPPWLEVKDLRRFDGLFNWTMSYRRDSDVLTTYGFVGRKHDKFFLQQDKRETRMPHPPLDKILGNKTDKAIWLVSNCQTDSNREEYVRRLRNVYPVDIRGGCGIEGCRPAETKKCYVELADQYKFYLAFENAICEEYVTEKLFNPLEYFVVPVTLGGADYSALTPPNSVINAMDFSSPEELGQYLWKVSKNESLYLSYFEWKATHRSFLQPWACDLCEKLHRGSTLPKTYYDLERWWKGKGPCLRWKGAGFEAVQRHTFPKYHSRLFK